jgi:hypothetical protein
VSFEEPLVRYSPSNDLTFHHAVALPGRIGMPPVCESAILAKRFAGSVPSEAAERRTQRCSHGLAHPWGLSVITVERIWAAIELRPHRAGHVKAIRVHEKSQIQALDRRLRGPDRGSILGDDGAMPVPSASATRYSLPPGPAWAEPPNLLGLLT